MSVDWHAMQKEMSPIKNYEDLRSRWQEAFAYPFVCKTYNFTMLEIAEYTQHLLGEDTRQRYAGYAQRLVETFNQLSQRGVEDIQDLLRQIGTCKEFEIFTERTRAEAKDLMAALKYLVYWFIPSKKLLSGLVSNDSSTKDGIQVLRYRGIRTNLEILQKGLPLLPGKLWLKVVGFQNR
jgi:hypothetical protein